MSRKRKGKRCQQGVCHGKGLVECLTSAFIEVQHYFRIFSCFMNFKDTRGERWVATSQPVHLAWPHSQKVDQFKNQSRTGSNGSTLCGGMFPSGFW